MSLISRLKAVIAGDDFYDNDFHDLVYEVPSDKRDVKDIETKTYPNSEEYFSKLIELEPENTDYYFCRSKLRGRAKNYEGQVKDLSQIIRLLENNKVLEGSKTMDKYYISRARAKYELGDYNGTIEDCENYNNLNPKSIFGFEKSALSKYHLGDYEGAESDALKALKIVEQDSYFYSKIMPEKYDFFETIILMSRERFTM